MRPDRPTAIDEAIPYYELRLREDTLSFRVRQVSLVLGTLLIVASVILAFYPRSDARWIVAPAGLVGAGVVLIRFAGQPSKRLISRDGWRRS